MDHDARPVNRILKWLAPGLPCRDGLTKEELMQAIDEYNERLRLGLANQEELSRLNDLLLLGPID